MPNMSLNKLITRFICIFFIALIIIQYKLETYIKSQQEKYCMFENVKRKNYTPAIFYYIYISINDNYKKDRKKIPLIYSTQRNFNLNSFHGNSTKDLYFVHCYY